MNCHLIAIPFTGVGLGGGYKSDRWFAHRIEIFKNYTLKSLANQENKNFLLWLWMRPEEETNPLVQEIKDAIEAVGLRYHISYNGLLYWDDKFTNPTLKLKVRNFLKMLWDGYHEKDLKPISQLWRYTWDTKNNTLEERLRVGLNGLKTAIGDEIYEWVYITRIDSDDMFHTEVVDLIQSSEPAERKALTMDKGYMYNTVTGQLGEWLPPTNPPFHTIIFPGSVFFSAKGHKAYYGDFHSHEDIPKVFDTEQLDLYKYCVTAHGTDHISTAWDVPLPKRIYQSFKYRPYCYTSSGRNISTHWQSRARKKKNFMIGKEFTDQEEIKDILAGFGV